MSREVVVETRLPHRLAGNGCPTVVSPGAGAGQETFRVLDGDDPDDFALWVAIWESWTQREVFAHPCYARLFTRESGKPRCGCPHDGCMRVHAGVRSAARGSLPTTARTDLSMGGINAV